MLTIRKAGRWLPNLASAAFFAVCLAWAGAAEAQFIVTSATDDGLGTPMSGTLSDAIRQANAAGGTITFGPGITTVTLTGSQYGISALANITIIGGGVTINANGFQAFTVNSGNVEFQNLTINGGRAIGAAGGNGNGGGGGGLGGGGAIYVDPLAGAVGITNVTFTNNQAIGGAGGTGDGASANGGDGGGYNGNAGPNTAPSNTGGGAGAVGAGNGTAGGYGGGGGGGSAGAATPAPGNGGGSGGLSGEGGDGGLALGGALFIGNGNTTTIRGGTIIAASNSATGGAGGAGTSTANNGTAGNGNGGGLYVGINGNAIFDNSTTDITVAGNIFSNGFLIIQGAGTGVVNFTGTTIVSTASNPLASTTVSSGTLNGTTNSITGAVVNNSIVRFTQSGLGAFNGTLAGTGRVDLAGNGTIIFDEVNTQTGLSTNTFTYNGPTNINNGTLFLGTALTNSSVNIGVNGGFFGNGNVGGNLTNSGVYAPGDGIGSQAVGGNFTSNAGSVTQIQINSGGNTPGTNNDVITAGGNAVLNGGTVFVQTTGGVYTVGTAYTFLTYGGARAGTFDGAVTNSAFLGADIDYTVPQAVRLILTRNATSYASTADTFNQAQVAGYLDANSAGAMGDFGTVIDNINSLSAAGARNAFDQLAGSIYGTTGRMGIQQTSFMYLMLRRGSRGNEEIGYEELHADGRIAGEGNAGDESIQLVNFNEDAQTSLTPVLRIRRQPRHTWNVWSTSYGTLSNGIGDGLNADSGRFGSFGTLTSVYRYIDDGLKFGMFGGYNHLNLRLINPYQSNNSNDYQLGSYLRGDDGTSYFLAASSIGLDNYQSRRTISFAQIARQASANYDGMQTTGYLEIGRKVPMWPLDFEPFASLQYTYLRQGSFTESGANSINLSVPGIDSSSLRSMIGTRAALDLITLAGEPVKMEFLFAWMHENLDANTTIRSTFAGVGGAAFATDGVNFGRDWTVLGAGLTWAPTENTALAANYDALLNDTTNFHLGSASFQYRW